MKKYKNIIILLVVTNLIFMATICNMINKNGSIIREKRLIKEMTQSENEANLQTQINQLNASHKEYSANVQAYKKQIADAITNQGVATSENNEGSVIAENIEKILQARTKDATATAQDIAKGKTAYVNGELITGTSLEKKYEHVQLYSISTTVSSNTITQNIQIPNDCEHGMLIVLLDGGVNGRAYTSISITGDISNINTIYDKGMPTSSTDIRYQLFANADFVPNGIITLKIGTTDEESYYETSKAILLY